MEEKELLERALSEINSLRNQNQLMRARLDMFDNIMSALHGEPARERLRALEPDIAYEIQKKLASYAQPHRTETNTTDAE